MSFLASAEKILEIIIKGRARETKFVYFSKTDKMVTSVHCDSYEYIISRETSKKLYRETY